MKLSSIKKSLTSFATGLLAAVALVTLTTGSAQAIQIPYEDIGTTSIENPVFNTYTNVPNGVGNEADFVRIRPSTGDVADNGVGGVRNALYVNGQDAECNVGDKFDIRTYIHNGADDDFNNNGSGSAVAHNTDVRMVAPLNTAGKTFTFTSTVRATDVSPVNDTARLYCDIEEDVMLRLVPQSVKVYSSQYGYQGAADSAVNGTLPIGSRVLGSGDVWGCWADRVIVAYIVEVVEMPKEEEPIYSCDLLALTLISDRKYRFQVAATAQNGATITGYRVDPNADNNSDADVITSDKNTMEYTYAKAGDYKIKASVMVKVGDETKEVSGDNCVKNLTIKDDVEMCPVEGKGHLPKDSPDCRKEVKVVEKPKTPTVLPNTGAGSIAGIFAATTAAGTALHRRFTLKRK